MNAEAVAEGQAEDSMAARSLIAASRHRPRVDVSQRRVRTFSAASPSADADGKTVGLSFCGGGFMGAYHVGVWTALREHHGAWLAQAPVTGASVGSLVGAGIVSDVDPRALGPVFDKVATRVRSLPLGAMTPFLPALVDFARVELENVLPADAHERCSGRLFVAVTEGW